MTNRTQLNNIDELISKLSTCLVSLQERNTIKPMPNITKLVDQTQTMINHLHQAKSKLIMSHGNTDLDIYRLGHPKEISELRVDIANHIRNPYTQYQPLANNILSKYKDIPQAIIAQLYQQVLKDEQTSAIKELDYKIINQPTTQTYTQNSGFIWGGGANPTPTTTTYTTLQSDSTDIDIQNAIKKYISNNPNDPTINKYRQALLATENIKQIKDMLQPNTSLEML